MFFFSVSPHSLSPFLDSLQTFRSNIDRPSRSQKIRQFCSLLEPGIKNLGKITGSAMKNIPRYDPDIWIVNKPPSAGYVIDLISRRYVAPVSSQHLNGYIQLAHINKTVTIEKLFANKFREVKKTMDSFITFRRIAI